MEERVRRPPSKLQDQLACPPQTGTTKRYLYRKGRYVYFRFKDGRLKRLPDDERSPEFSAAYDVCLQVRDVRRKLSMGDRCEPAQIGAVGKRDRFWRYCAYAAQSAMYRAKKKGVPCTITHHDLDRLLVDQRWCCAVSGVPLIAPRADRGPFGPSLDRIVPSLGYVPGNIRIVCNLVNFAMNKWGDEPLRQFVRRLALTTQWATDQDEFERDGTCHDAPR